MSQRNVEIVRAMNEAYLRGDYPRAMEPLDQDIEWRGAKGGLDEGKVYRGQEEVAMAFADNLMTWETLKLDYERYIDAGDHVVVFVHEVARGLKSRAEVETDTAVVFTFQRGKIVRARAFMDRAEALEAVGLSE